MVATQPVNKATALCFGLIAERDFAAGIWCRLANIASHEATVDRLNKSDFLNHVCMPEYWYSLTNKANKNLSRRDPVINFSHNGNGVVCRS